MGHPLEKIYPFVPVFLQNVGISLWGLAWQHERLGGRFDQHVAEFRERDAWSPEQMQAHVKRELNRVLCRAFDQVPYYRRTWVGAGISRDDLAQLIPENLPKLPITPKEDLRGDPSAFIAADVPPRQISYYHSSGSTGTPIVSACRPQDHRRFIAAREVRSFGWAGSTIRDPRAMIGGRLVVPRGVARPPFYRYNRAEHQVYFSAYHIAPAHVVDYVAGFNRHRPALLTGYANSYYLLARMMCEQGLSLDYQPKAAVLSSEKLTNEMRCVIQKAFGVRAFEEYGAVENCVLATECERGSLHASPDFGLLEIVDQNGNPSAPGQEGRILCTSFLNETQPLIRYEIGDLGIWSKSQCDCGRHQLPVLQEIVGRLEDVVVGPDGRELVRFHGIFIGVPNVCEGQVIQETRDSFIVKVVTRDGFVERDCDLIRKHFTERLGPVQVAIEKVSIIPRNERGKFRAVISKVKSPIPVGNRS